MKPCNLFTEISIPPKKIIDKTTDDKVVHIVKSLILSMIIISFITIFDSICSPDAEIKEVTCSRYINDIIPDGLASSDSDECMHGIIVDICTMQINTILLYYIS